jgi:hypothetical protein
LLHLCGLVSDWCATTWVLPKLIELFRADLYSRCGCLAA